MTPWAKRHGPGGLRLPDLNHESVNGRGAEELNARRAVLSDRTPQQTPADARRRQETPRDDPRRPELAAKP